MRLQALKQKPLDTRYRHSGTTDRRRRARPDLDPGSRPESQRVMSCANRLVVTSSEYRDDDKVRYTGKTMLLVLTTAQQLLSNAQLLLSRPSWMRSEQILQRTGFSVSEFSAAWSMLQIPRGAGHRSFAQDVSMAVKIWCREGGSNPHGCYPGGF